MLDLETLSDALRWLNELRQTKECPAILVGNKMDEESIVVPEEDLDEIQDQLDIPCILTSALTGQQIDAAFTLIIQMAY